MGPKPNRWQTDLIRPVRKTTNRLIELAEDGVISWEDIARTALNWLSEDDVNQMARVNEFLPEDEEDDTY
jgi:hypothetical protein